MSTMRAAILLQHPALLRHVFLETFLRWYVLEKPVKIVKAYVAYAKALAEIFSIFFLLRTLFSPWKNILDRYPSKGFDLNRILQTFFLNLTTRMVGACIRLFLILAGIVAQCVALLATLVILIAWILLLVSPVFLFFF